MILAWDSETELITDYVKAPRLVCVSYAREDNRRGLFKWDQSQARRLVQVTLESDTSVTANGAYDMGVVATQWPELLPLIFQAYDADRVIDVQIAQQLLDIADGVHMKTERAPAEPGKKAPGPYSLASLAWRHLRRPMDKSTWRLRYGELRDVPLEEWPEGAKDYPIDDAVTTLDVWQSICGSIGQDYQSSDWFKGTLLEDLHRQCRHSFWLHLVTCWGIRTDLARVAALRDRLAAERDALLETPEGPGILARAGLLKKEKKKGAMVWVAKKAPAQKMMVEACARRGVQPKLTDPSNTFPDGQVSVDKEACADSGDPNLEALAHYASLHKRLTTDIVAMEKGEIHDRFELLVTGRTRAEYVQIVPKEGGARECFVPRPGFVFANADIKGLEIATIAQCCLEILGHSTIADVINNDGDAHLELAAEFMGISVEEAERRREEGDKLVEKRRDMAKPTNFGRAGGMGDETFISTAKKQYGVIFTPEEAQVFKQTWLRKYPEMREWLAWGSRNTRNGNASFTTLYSHRTRGDMPYTEFCNNPFQSLGSDVAKAMGWALAKACYLKSDSPLYGSRIVNFVHDEYLLEVPVDIAHAAATEMARVMIEASRPWLPDVRVSTKPLLAMCWSKKAKPVVVEGLLVPWTPEAA